MQTDLLAIDRWCTANFLKLNPQKTHYVIFSGRKTTTPTLNVLLNTVKIEKVTEMKFLGCILDERLKAIRHVEELGTILSRAIFLLKSLSCASGYSATKLMYTAYFHSHVSYCAAYWRSSPKSQLKKLYSLQRRAVRVITPPHRDPKTFGDLDILPLPQALSYNVCLFIDQQIIGEGPLVLNLMMQGSERLVRTTGTRLIKLENRKTG